jgi:hypothetical protein
MKKYKTAAALLTALNERLKAKASKEGIDIQRLRRQVAFDRLLLRLFNQGAGLWVLKGGYAMELRITHPRATKDIDLAVRDTRLMSHDPDEQNFLILDELREYANRDLGDFFLFQVGDPVMDLAAAPYGGARFPVTALSDGRLFVRFSLDVAVGDPVIEPLDTLIGEDWLGFAGLHSKGVPALSKEQQFAEKLHAYSLPRDGRLNSRVKDLVDMLLLIQTKSMDAVKLQEAIEATFSRRKTHTLPAELTPPPSLWQGPFAQMAQECELTTSLESKFDVVSRYYQDMLTTSITSL